MKIRLNLATTPLENNRRFILGAALVGILALGAFAWLAYSAYRSYRETGELRGRIAVLQADLRRFQALRRELEAFFKSADTRRVMERAAFLNGLIEQRSFPWTQIFTDLERLLPEGVRVISIAPRMSEGRVEVRLVVGAASDEAKLKFLQALDGAGQFSRVQLVSETHANRPGQADSIVVELVAWYASGMP